MIKKVKDFWDYAADSWDDFIRAGKDVYKDFIIAPATLELLPAISSRPGRALDLCCGEGYYSRLLQKQGYNVCGVDLSKKMIAIARKKALSIPYYCRNAGNLSIFPRNRFNLVVCSMALMDAPNYKAIIKAVYRVLKPGGCFIVSITHPCFSFEKAGAWERNEKGEKAFFKMDNYFIEDAHEVAWDMPRLKHSFKSMAYHRTISSYFSALTEVGFTVDRFHEPYYKGADGRFANSKRIAYFLFFRCKKVKP
jgi:ubiquinone/menaquinone biosynthesis C-methylase UbiE